MMNSNNNSNWNVLGVINSNSNLYDKLFDQVLMREVLDDEIYFNEASP